MPAAEVRACSGYELVQAIAGVFEEVIPAMNCCMQVPLAEPPSSGVAATKSGVGRPTNKPMK